MRRVGAGLGFRVPGFGFRVRSSEFRGSGSGFQVSCFGFRVSGFGFRVRGLGLRVSGSGFGGLGLLCFLDCDCDAWVHLRFRGGRVSEAHRLLYHSTLGLIVIKKKKKVRLRNQACSFRVQGLGFRVWGLGSGVRVQGLGRRASARRVQGLREREEAGVRNRQGWGRERGEMHAGSAGGFMVQGAGFTAVSWI